MFQSETWWPQHMEKLPFCLDDFAQCCQSDNSHNSKIHFRLTTRNKGRSLYCVFIVPPLADMSLLKMYCLCVIPVQGNSKIRLDKSASCHIKPRKIQGQAYIIFFFFFRFSICLNLIIIFFTAFFYLIRQFKGPWKAA